MSILTDAVSLANFWDTLSIQSVVWDELDQAARSQLGAGAHIGYDMGGMLWRATVVLNPDDAPTMKARLGRLRAMRKLGSYFLATDPLCRTPAADPAGTIAASPLTVGSIDNETGEWTLAGGPDGYVLDQGHMFHVDFGVPARRGLFSMDKAATFNAGSTGAFTTTPVPWAGIVVGDPVSVLRPSAVFAILPDSSRRGPIKAIVEGGSFDMLQVLDA